VRKIATALATGALVLSGAAPALAAPSPEAYGDVVGVARITSPTTAEVQVRYSCSREDPAVALWVAVKQGDRLVETPDHTGTSSRNADAYAQSHAEVGTLRCDGKTHVQTFTVNQTEPTFPGAPPSASGFGALTQGAKTYVQFCLTPASATGEQDVIQGVVAPSRDGTTEPRRR
jgi:hypothetical protein